jgi:F-type H+-transporting ATPase subunit gamma
MALALNKTKRRISSVKGTEKITEAMELVATVKLKKFRDANAEDSLYAEEFASLMSELFANDSETGTHYGKINEGVDKTLYIVISSNLGLCGSYNNALFKYFDRIAKPADAVAPVGQRGMAHFVRTLRYLDIDSRAETLNLSLDLKLIHELCASFKEDFNEKKYKNVCVVYTRYINSLNFAPTCFQLLPVQLPRKQWEHEEYCPPLFDMPPRELIHRLIPDYLASVFYDLLIESQLSEQASRRTAMKNANDNAESLLAKLQIEYNKARQNAITQEITEVIAGGEGR